MSWFGKMLGGTIGMMIGGPLGAIAGGAIGHHLFDKPSAGGSSSRSTWQSTSTIGGASSGRGDGFSGGASRPASGGVGGPSRPFTASASAGPSAVERRQATFFLALFSILGKLAKADGRITREEGEAVVGFLDRMGVRGDQRQFAIRVFNEAKNSRHDVEELARQFAEATSSQREMRASLIDMLFQVAVSDGEYHPAEEAVIRTVAGIVGISPEEQESIKGRYISNPERAYSVLGLTSGASDDDVRSTYRQLVQEYHPDHVTAQGMPEEFVEYASQRFQEIQAAWEQIKRDRKL